MENNTNDIDKFFKEHLSGHESNYVPGAWERMENMLNEGDKGFFIKNVRNYVLASVVGAIALGGSLVAYISDSATQDAVVAKTSYNKEAISKANITTTAPTTTATNTAENINSTTENTTNSNTTGTTLPPTKATFSSTLPPALPVAKIKETATIDIAPLMAKDNADTYEKNQYYFENIPGAKNAAFETPNATTEITDTRGKIDSAQQIARQINAIRSHYHCKLGITFGANFNSIISNTSSSNQFGSGVLAGVQYSKNFSRRFGIMAELAYLRRTGHNLTRNINQTRYFFEKSTIDYFLVTKTTDHIQLPILARYNFTSKHAFAFGLVTSYMIDSRTEVATSSEMPGEKSSVTETKKGVYEDMNPFGFGISAGYEFKLPGLYSIGLRYNQQLNDITKNSYFKDGKKHLPTDVQVYIKLDLIK